MGRSCAVCGRVVGSGSDGREREDELGEPGELGDLGKPDEPVYCCAGCQSVANALEPRERTSHTDKSTTTATATDGSTTTATATDEPTDTETYLRVDGMHAATCEAYLERVATSQPGVSDAAASYVTETVRVDHDPAVTSAHELQDALSTTGYTAYRRADAGAGESGSKTRRARELTGTRKRRSDEILGLRYAAGIVFGAFLMVPYVAVLYPAHLASVVEYAALDAFEGTFELTGASGFLFLRIYFVLTAIVLFFTGMPVLRGAYVSVKMRRPTTDLLVALTVVSAFIYSTGAVLIGENDIYYDLTLVVAATVTGVAFYETSIKQRALERLTSLTVSQVTHARRYDPAGSPTDANTEDQRVPVSALSPGDRILVRSGERIPVDGTLVGDECTVEEAVVTGESLPVVKRAGDDVVGGAVVTDAAAVVAVGDPVTSSVDRITRSLWSIQSATHGIARRADRLAGRIAPVVVGSAVVGSGAALATGSGPVAAALAGLLAILVSSPWTIGLAAPLAVSTSIRDALERGIVVFDDTVFERLRGVDTVVFDKTGTLTTGQMEVIAVDVPTAVLAGAAAIERQASHPAAAAVVAAAADTPADTAGLTVDEFETHDTGVSGTVDGHRLLVGTVGLFDSHGWAVDEATETAAAAARSRGRLPVIVGRDGTAAGIVVVGDEPREGWEATLSGLAERDISVVILTGDDPEATSPFDEHEAVTHVFAGMSPDGKTAAVERLQADRTVAMVGDGTNDAPALARVDLGFSLGSGTALAADAADIAIVDDDLSLVAATFEAAATARRRLDSSIGLGLAYNAIAIPAAVAGVFNPLIAAVAVVVGGGLVAVNCSRDLFSGPG